MAEILGDSTANNLVGSGNGNDSIVGFEGDDTLFIEDYSGSSNTLDGGAGADNLYSSYSSMSLFRGGDDNDILEVYGWNNTLEGGLGDDTYNLYYASGNTIQDAGGTDILSTGLKLSLNGLAAGEAGLEKQGTSLVIDINQDGVADTTQDLVILDFFNAPGTGAGTGFIEKIDYLDGNEIITPPTSPNIITGTANADNLEGTNANDSIIGDAGDDSISSDGSGNDTLRGGDGNDNLIDFGAGNDFLDGGIGNDTLDGGMGNNTLDGGAGDDYLSSNQYYYYSGYSDQDSLFGGDGNDTLLVGSYWLSNTLDGGAGADSLYSSYSDSSLLLGGDDNDILEVYGWNNTLEGGLGDDTLSLISDSGSGNILRGGSGSDIYRVRAGYWGQAGVEIDDTEGTDTLIILESQFQNGEIFDPMPVEPISALDPMPLNPTPTSVAAPMPVESTPTSPVASMPVESTSTSPVAPMSVESTSTSPVAPMPVESTSNITPSSVAPMPLVPTPTTTPMPLESTSTSPVAPMPVEPTSTSPVAPMPVESTSTSPVAPMPVPPAPPISVDLTMESTEVTETPMTLSATALAKGTVGLGRVGTSLVIDVSSDGIATRERDIVITNFFDAAGTGAGSGFIETINNLSGQDILTNAANLPEVTFQAPPEPTSPEPLDPTTPAVPDVVDRPDVNDAPVVTNRVVSQSHDWNENFSLTLAADTFTDPEGGELTYGATQVSFVDWFNNQFEAEGDLPDWLTFDPTTLTFSTEDTDRSFFIEIEVTATDPEGASATDWFRLWSNGISGIAIDGYIADATAFFDANRNGVLDPAEPSAITIDEGKFTLNVDFTPFDLNNNGRLDPEEGRIVISGGTDTATGLPLATPLVATPDTATVTLLSNVVSDLVDQGVSKADAETQVKAALGIPAEIDLSNTDPIAATAQNQAGGVQLNSAMVKLQNAVTQMANTISGASSLSVAQSSQTVVGAIAAQIQAGTTLDLTNASQLQTVLEAAGTKAQVDLGDLSESVAQIIAEANERIDTVVANNTGADLNQELARVQSVALGTTSDNLNAAAAGTKAIASVVEANTSNALDILISNTKLDSESEKISSESMPVAPVGAGAVAIFSLPTILPSSPETIKLARPTANATDPGAPTGEVPNQVMGEFYNLSDSNDNIVLSQITEAIGLHVRGLSGNDIIQGSEGADEMNGNQGNDIVKGNIGNDVLRGGQGADEVDGESEDDVLNGNQDNDNVFGGDGNDLLRGGKGDDNLMGGNGNDVLCGDMGQDFLTGDSGSDTFVLRSGEAAASTSKTADVILDFNSSEDKIGLTDGVTYQNLTFEAVNFGLGDASAIASVAIKADNKYLGIVQGFTEEDLTASMFVKADELILLG